MNLRDLAQSLGLSQTTVSRALNGYPEVSEATRIKVREAADKHGYHPDTRARSLATGRAMAIGLVIPMAARHEIVNPIFTDFIAGAGETLAERGYDMVLSLVSGADETGVYRSLVSKGRVDGVIVQAPLTIDARIDFLSSLGLPFVVHGRSSSIDSEQYAWLDMDNRRAFRRATQHLIALGHRRIALLNGQEEMDFARRRREGFDAEMTAAGLPIDPELMCSQAMTETYGFDETMRLLAMDQPPSAILTSSMLVAMGVRRAADAFGLKLGRDLSVVTHDDGLSYLPNGAPDQPIFTATHAPIRDAGHIAAKMLLRQIEQPHLTPRHTQIEALLVIGPSSGPVPATASEPDPESGPESGPESHPESGPAPSPKPGPA